VPYLHLTVLTPAAGLGTFMGVTESPATHSGAVLELVGPCSTNAARSVANANPSPITVTLTLPNGGTLVVPPHPGADQSSLP